MYIYAGTFEHLAHEGGGDNVVWIQRQLRLQRLICIRQQTSAYVSIRQHTSAYISIRLHTSRTIRTIHVVAFIKEVIHPIHVKRSVAIVHVRARAWAIDGRRGADWGSRRAEGARNKRSIRQHTSANVSIRQHTSANVSKRQQTSANVSKRQQTSANVSTRHAPEGARHTRLWWKSRENASDVSVRSQYTPKNKSVFVLLYQYSK